MEDLISITNKKIILSWLKNIKIMTTEERQEMLKIIQAMGMVIFEEK